MLTSALEPGEGLGKGSVLNRLRCACLTLLLASAALAAPASALPITLTLAPSATLLTPNQTLSVDVVVAGLTELVGEFVQEIALEGFDLALQFDETRLSYQSLTFGTSLGQPSNSFVSGPGANPNGTGLVTMLEFSGLTAGQLLALQSAPFTLATITFKALALPGTTQLELVNLDDASLVSPGSVPRGIDFGLAPPSALTVEILPEPGAAALLLAAAALLARRASARRA